MDYDESIDYRLVSYKENWSFTPIWKNATASIFKAFSNKFPDLPPSISKHEIHSLIYSWPENDDLFMLHKDSDEYKYFSKQAKNIVCVRDPYERFISAFYHKLILNPNGKEARDFLKKNNISGLDNLQILNKFVAYLTITDDADPHFISQTKLASLNDVKYDHVISFNNLNREWKSLQSIYPNIPDLETNKIHQTDSKHFANEVRNNSRMFKRIEMLYLDDYIFLRNNNK